MGRNNTKYIVDASLFVATCSLAATGFIIGTIVPPGSGRGRFFLGLHRHQWGEIHSAFALLLLCGVILHIVLSWSWVMNTSKRILGAQWKRNLALLCGAWIVALFIAYVLAWF